MGAGGYGPYGYGSFGLAIVVWIVKVTLLELGRRADGGGVGGGEG